MKIIASHNLAKRAPLAGMVVGGLFLAAGCATRDARLSDRLWNRPTREELSSQWWLRDSVPDETAQRDKFLDHYP